MANDTRLPTRFRVGDENAVRHATDLLRATRCRLSPIVSRSATGEPGGRTT